ncbi:MAG: glycosyltransferase family 39 protein, partial [Anaerolineae bacterium]
TQYPIPNTQYLTPDTSYPLIAEMRTNLTSPKNLIRPGAMVITALGFALRLYTLASESLWYDELLQLDIAQGPLPSMLPRLQGHAAVPLDYLIAHAWILLGRGEGWVRIPAVMFGTLALPVAYRLGRSLLGRYEGLLLMALLALSPMHVRYSQEVRPYALVVLGVTLAGYAFWQMRRTGRWRYFILLQVGAVVITLAHVFGTAVFGPLLVLAAVDLAVGKDRKRAVKSMAGLLAAGFLSLMILLSLGWGRYIVNNVTGFGGAVVEPEKFTVDPSQKPNLGSGPEVNGSFIKNEIVAPLGAGAASRSLWLFNGLAGLGLVYLLSRKQYRLGLLLILWLVLPVVSIVAFLVYRGTFFASRYIISILPAYLSLVVVGLLALFRWLKRIEFAWLSIGVALIIGASLAGDLGASLNRLYHEQDKEDWRLVGQFIAQNAGPDDAVIAVNAEPTMNWYYPPAWAVPNRYETLESVQAAAAEARRSWVILSLFSSDIDASVKAWLGEGEQGAIRLVLDPEITVYYLGRNATQEQLLEEIQGFALPVDHALYASLARENRRRPAVARRYYQLAIEHAPTGELRAEYRRALDALP